MLHNNRVALYARYSSDNQRSESIDAQLRAMTEYCQQRKLIIVRTYIDEAKSGMSSDKRSSFLEMIEDASSRDNPFDIVLVHKLDRFARNRYDSAIYKRQLKLHGVLVWSVLENLDNSPESVILESVLEGMSEYYSKNLAREVLKGLKENALACKHTGGRPPYGFSVVDSYLVINESEAEAIRIIFSRYADGHGYTSIINELSAKGFLTRTGKPFSKNSLHDILINEKYKGVFVYNKSASANEDGSRNSHARKPENEIIRIPGGCPQIVDFDTFDAVQRRIKSRKRSNLKSYQMAAPYLLTGKIHCGICGRAMYGNTHESGQAKTLSATYRCPSNRYSCGNKQINRLKLENYVISLLEEKLLNPSAMKEAASRIYTLGSAQAAEASEYNQTLRDQVQEINTSISNITSVIEKGLASTTLLSRLTQLEQEKASLESELGKLLKSAANTLNSTAIDWKYYLDSYQQVKRHGSPNKYREVLQQYLVDIVVYRYKVDIIIGTGFGCSDNLNQTFTVTTKEIYSNR